MVVEQALKLPRWPRDRKKPLLRPVAYTTLPSSHLANFLGLLPILTHKLIANRQRTISDHGDHYSRVPMG